MNAPGGSSNKYMPLHQWCSRRERGLGPRFGDADTIHRTIYRSLEPKKIWNDPGRFPGIVRDYGGAFNLEFSPDGTLLVAACEKKSIVLFDPLTEIQICAVKNAHTECVNCIKFIDDRIFATCSDDTTVALWDIRNLTTKLRTLNGHSGWVKNIEYSKRDRMLLSSGFDGSIYAWEINNFTEYGSVYRRVLHTSGLLRSRLTPDESRLVLSMSSGYLMIIHDLDLANLASDLDGFYPNVYRLMQVGGQLIPMAARFRPMFYSKRKKNRIELVTDFPPNNNPEIISGLAIHPQGWCALSRNLSTDETTEYSVVHDIQALPQDEEIDEDDEEVVEREQERREEQEMEVEDSMSSGSDVTSGPQPGTSGLSGRSARNPSHMGSVFRLNVTMREMIPSVDSNNEPAAANPGANNEPEPSGSRSNLVTAQRQEQPHGGEAPGPSAQPVVPTGSVGRQNGRGRRVMVTGRYLRQDIASTDIWATEITYRERKNMPNPQVRNNRGQIYGIVSGVSSSSSIGYTGAGRKRITETVATNTPRMLYYIQESSMRQAYIKESCFSPDGRIICSPHENGFRLLSFNENCTQLQHATGIWRNQQPQQLQELKQKQCHSAMVVSSQFSSRYPLLVTGCLRGKIVWHQPALH
ncbi:DDB1- and CUL4-associated factor 10 homolog [Anopheles maculipalpis]|uniref:DDB1- and CUL4-associated factor 10 homolog n=1 Tax=Anopheles maculipalpis TaxID=1496333 RepID=UPI0021596CB7|nr:DDB1- and CUL4-associated factor 10 homolog [Anopheles maculipalpis]